MLERWGQPVLLLDWAADILAQCAPIAQALDAAHGSRDYSAALAAAQAGLAAPDTLPSARVLQAMKQDVGGSYTGFVRAQAEQTRQHLAARVHSVTLKSSALTCSSDRPIRRSSGS